MTPQNAEKLADLLDTGRKNAKLVQGFDAALQPQTVDDAYAVHAAMAKRNGAPAGWKIMAIVPSQRETLKVDRPIAAPIWKSYITEAPARLELRSFVEPALECEFDFVLARDLPARATPYTRDEVVAAVSVMRPAIEIVDSRVGRPVPTPLILADCFSNAALVLGRVAEDWRKLDLLTQTVDLKVDGKSIATGDGNKIMGGGPLHALTTLANNPPPWSGGLRAGQVITTGSCTGMPPLGQGREVVADFANLGEVRVSFG